MLINVLVLALTRKLTILPTITGVGMLQSSELITS